jgi:hypothetical protein
MQAWRFYRIDDPETIQPACEEGSIDCRYAEANLQGCRLLESTVGFTLKLPTA